MAEYNGKKFYGYSVENDPDLIGSTWNTKNFAFSCLRPEAVQRAIEKVSSDAGASMKQKKSFLLNQLREKCGDAETDGSSNQDREEDSVTQMLQGQSNAKLLNISAIYAREMNEGDNKEDSSEESSGSCASANVGTAHKAYETERSKGGESRKDMQIVSYEQYENPQPSWVEISEPAKASMHVFDLKNPLLPPPPPPCGYPSDLFQMPKFTYIQSPQAQQQQQQQQNIPHTMPPMGYIYDQQQIMENYPYQNPYGDYDPNAYVVEDSDLEDEMLRREHYTKFCEKRPEVIDAANTDDPESHAEFINIAPEGKYQDMSFLKSTIPMRYSELSEDEKEEEAQDHYPKVIIKNREQKDKNLTVIGKAAPRTASTKKDVKKEKDKPIKPAKNYTFGKLLEQERLISSQHAQAAKNLTAKRRPPSKPHTIHSPTSGRTSQRSAGTRYTNDSYTNMEELEMNFITINGKSLEQLKAEKIAIFNKMSRTQERLIDALQQLRTKLLEVYVPESYSDRQRRNRNGFEFSVRFLRNFLYPLKGMIDAVRNTSRDQFNSVRSNDACNRVAHIYSLFLQAVCTYSKQIRHFMIDQVPQKLTTLLEMLCSTTNMCLEKRLFDRNDAIVQCLQGHCGDLLAFLEDLHAQRFVVARTNPCRKVPEELEKPKYDLRMFMNDLNMYEPKIVPKKFSGHRPPRIVPRKTSKTLSHTQQNSAPNQQTLKPSMHPARKRVKQSRKQSKLQLEKCDATSNSSPEEKELKHLIEDVDTEVQNWNARSSDNEPQESREMLQKLHHMIQSTNADVEKYHKLDMVNRSIMNALNMSKHNQSREILQPVLKTIENALDVSEDDNEIEKILKAFQMKISTLLNEKKFQHEAKDYSGHHNENASDGESMRQTYLNEQESDDDEIQNINPNNHHEYCDTNRNYYRNADSNDGECNYEDNDYNDDDYDDDTDDNGGQFYMSGGNYTEKQYKTSTAPPKATTTAASMRNRIIRLEPLVETVEKSEADEFYSSDAEAYTAAIRTNNTPRQQFHGDENEILMNVVLKTDRQQSSHVLPQSRRSHKAQKSCKSPGLKKTTHHSKHNTSSGKSTQCQVTPASSTVKKMCAKTKLTTVPPSPAMMRLKQQNQHVNIMETRKKANILKKRAHRNPMGSPPPPPTVSPSTSLAHTQGKNAGNTPASMSHSSSSHKGVTINITKNLATNSSDTSNREYLKYTENAMQLKEFFNIGCYDDTNSATSHSPPSSSKKYDTFNDNDTDNDDTYRESAYRNHVQSTQEEMGAYSSRRNSRPPKKEEEEQQQKERSRSRQRGSGDRKEKSNRTHHNSNLNESENPYHNNDKAKDKIKEKEPKVEVDVSSLLRERDQYLSLCIRNRLYTNPNFIRPWQILSRFTHQLSRDLVRDVEADFNAGVLNFVDDFLQLETRI